MVLEALAPKKASTICEDGAFTSFWCVLSLSSALGRFTHLCCDTGSLGRGAQWINTSPPPSSPTFAIYVFAVNILSKAGENPQSAFKWYKSQDFDKFLAFFVYFLDVSSAALRLIDTYSKWKMLRSYTYWAHFTDMGSAFLQFWILKFFRTCRNCRFTLLLGEFLARTPQKQPSFLTSDGKQDDVSDMLQFFEVFRNCLIWAKKLIFWLILHPMRHTPRFCQMKDLIKIYICGKFHQYRICGCEMKDFQVFLY